MARAKVFHPKRWKENKQQKNTNTKIQMQTLCVCQERRIICQQQPRQELNEMENLELIV